MLASAESEGYAWCCEAIGSMDLRPVLTRITAEGMTVLGRLDGPVLEAHRQQLGHLGEKRLNELSELLAACRSRLD